MPVALVGQHAKRLPRVVSSVVCPALLYFTTDVIYGTIFEGKKILAMKYVGKVI